MWKQVSYVIIALTISVSQTLAAPLDDVRKVVDDVVHIVADKDLKKHEQQRRHALNKAISTIFNYDEMAKRSLGKHWSELPTDEQKRFADLYASLLERSYAGKIESYNNEKIIYVKEMVENDYAEIRSKVVTANRDEFTLDYRLIKQHGKWMVYDVVVEGVSLVSNYRSQFSRVITASGYGALVKKLKAKNNELKLQ